MKNSIIPFLIGFLFAILLMKTCQSCDTSPKSNATDNINQVDSLQIIKQAQNTLKGQIIENETIIASLSKTVDQLRAKEAQGNKRAGELAKTIEAQKKELEKQGASLERLTVLLAETEAKFEAPVTIEQGIGDEIGEELPTYHTEYSDPENWFSLKGDINPNTNLANYSLNVRNEFEIADFKAADGKAKFRVESKNPYSYVLPGTNSFEVPISVERPKNRRLGLGLTLGAFAGKDFFSKNVVSGYGLGFGLSYRLL